MADRYWGGGSGTWDGSSTTHWSTTSGGAGGASAPTSSDNAIFDTLSNLTGYTVTMGSGAVCSDVSFGAPASGVLNWAGSTALNVYGSFVISSYTLFASTYTGTLTFKATSGTKNVTIPTSSGTPLHLVNPFVFDGVGGTWHVTNAIDASSINVVNGSLDSTGAGQILIVNSFSSSNSNVRSINIAGGQIKCQFFDLSTTTNLTWDATSNAYIEVSGSPCTFHGGGLSYSQLYFYPDSNVTALITGANSFTYFGGDVSSVTNTGLLLAANQTLSTAFDFYADTAPNRFYIGSTVVGTQRTITNNGITSSLIYIDFEDIQGAGSATWVGTSLANRGGCSGITFDNIASSPTGGFFGLS